jgi:hypothetical protein
MFSLSGTLAYYPVLKFLTFRILIKETSLGCLLRAWRVPYPMTGGQMISVNVYLLVIIVDLIEIFRFIRKLTAEDWFLKFAGGFCKLWLA